MDLQHGLAELNLNKGNSLPQELHCVTHNLIRNLEGLGAIPTPLTMSVWPPNLYLQHSLFQFDVICGMILWLWDSTCSMGHGSRGSERSQAFLLPTVFCVWTDFGYQIL